jgi:hypothetical protein
VNTFHLEPWLQTSRSTSLLSSGMLTSYVKVTISPSGPADCGWILLEPSSRFRGAGKCAARNALYLLDWAVIARFQGRELNVSQIQVSRTATVRRFLDFNQEFSQLSFSALVILAYARSALTSIGNGGRSNTSRFSQALAVTTASNAA